MSAIGEWAQRAFAAEREVERLTAERDEARMAAWRHAGEVVDLLAERDRLREELDKTLDAYCVRVKRHDRLRAALTDLEMAVSDLMREEDFEVSETLSCALDIARAALGERTP